MSIVTDTIYFLANHYQLFLILPIILALKTEKHYVGRAAILANTVGMFVAVAPKWDVTFAWLNIGGFPFFQVYVLIGLMFGFIAFLSYMSGGKMEGDFYVFSFLLYNSVIAGIVCLVASIIL
jgi:hypothetical protein